MTYRRILKSAVQAFVIAGTFMLPDVEDIYATETRVYSNFEEAKNESLTSIDNVIEALDRDRQWLLYESGSGGNDVLDLLDRFDRALATIEEIRQAVEASDNPTDFYQRCKSIELECTICRSIELKCTHFKASTTSNIGTWSQHDENMNEVKVDRYEKQWTEDRQNDGTNSRNSSESEYESSRKYNSKRFSPRINGLEAKLKSKLKSPTWTGLKEAVPIKKIKVGGKLAKKVLKKVGGKAEEYGEKVEKAAERVEEVKDEVDREKRKEALTSGDDEEFREAMKEIKIEGARSAGAAIGGLVGGPPGAAIGSGLGAGVVAGGIAQGERNREAEQIESLIKSLKEENQNLALLEKAVDGEKEAQDAVTSALGMNNVADDETPSEHNFLQTLRLNHARKFKASIAPGSGPMTLHHPDLMEKEMVQRIDKLLKEEEQEGP